MTKIPVMELSLETFQNRIELALFENFEEKIFLTKQAFVRKE